jgi:hypothetical protein
MKVSLKSSVSSVLFLGAMAVTATASAFADTAPAKVPVAFNHVYVVDGFDNNDNVQIVAAGRFNNSCYRNADTNVQIDHATKTIHMAPNAFKYNGTCLQVMMPFDRVVDFGILQEGTYTLVQGQNVVLGKINIHHSNVREADDAMYAPISQAYFENENGANKVFLTGEFPLSCMRVKEVRFNVQPEALVIQPIAEIDHSAPCTKGSFPFHTSTNVGPMKSGRYLLHVRSMNGKAISSLFDVP